MVVAFCWSDQQRRVVGEVLKPLSALLGVGWH
jgi:hypothetical protein